MTRTTHNGKSSTEHRIDTEPTGIGALELEYPADQGLYAVIFDRYTPEIADEIVSTAEVRRLVELEYNCRRIEDMLRALDDVDRETRRQVTEARRLLVSTLWDVSDAIADTYTVS